MQRKIKTTQKRIKDSKRISIIEKEVTMQKRIKSKTYNKR